MSDIVIFGFGCVVSLIVASAVGLLLWGAANEPEGELFDSSSASRPRSQSPTVSDETAHAHMRDSRSPA